MSCLGAGALAVLWGLSAAGCHFSAQASGQAHTGGETHAEAKAATETESSTEPAPPSKAAPSIQYRKGRLEYRGVINFEYDKAALRSDPATTETLAEFKKFLAKHSNVSLEIEGHTDSRGSDEYNLDLSERRAYAVRDWLIENGVDESRLTAVGKGETAPQTPEPEGCQDAEPPDTAACEEAWATNRRVVFEVTGGEETLPEAEPAPLAASPAPPPEPRPEAAPAASVRSCPWLFGGHLNGLGPNSFVMVAAATQPGVCWLELSLGGGYATDRFSASAAGLRARGHLTSLTFPLRGRIWFMEQGHSLVGDVGLGFTHFRMSATSADAAGGRLDYTRRTTPLLSSLALGYGFRPEGAQPGYRFTAMLGGIFHPTRLGDSSSRTENGFSAANAADLSTALDERTEDYTDPGLFGEVSLGLLF